MEETKQKEEPVQLCASCDRCRARKTKCDGQRPCSNCASKYMKKNKLSSIEGIDYELIGCVYSPAKRRGPHPGRSSLARSKAQQQQPSSLPGVVLDPHPLANFLTNASSINNSNNAAAFLGNGTLPPPNNNLPADIQQQLLQFQLRLPAATVGSTANNINTLQQQQPSLLLEHTSKKPKDEPSKSDDNVPRTVAMHLHLLDPSDPKGSLLRSYYNIAINEMFRLPVTPSDEEYCHKHNVPSMIPAGQLAALSAARFAQVALGAVIKDEIGLGMELCNAVVHCLRESVKEPVQVPALFEVAKTYFLLGIFRAFRGDMERYFKYRRVCMTYLAKLEDDNRVHSLIAAVTYLDAWAYMIYNGQNDALPNVDDTIPPIKVAERSNSVSETEKKYQIKVDACSIACHPENQHWIQGAPPVYLNNEAPLHGRALDAVSCAIRTCCDQANDRFNALNADADSGGSCGLKTTPNTTATSTAVMAFENELCSRNVVLSAFTLMQQSETSRPQDGKSDGLQTVISAMDAFLENGDESMDGGFTDSQIKNLLSVCTATVENPLLLHHAGPTYHMITNAAALLCHLMNGLHAQKKAKNGFGAMEQTLFEEVLDTYLSVRKLLTIHRRKLPVPLRCHNLPRPSLNQNCDTFIDLGETLLCPCRGCQGFVLMACSPCVAAERARAAANRMEVSKAQEAEAAELGDLPFQDLGAEFDLDDDALLNMISGLISG